MATPTTMQALVYRGTGEIGIEERPIPAPADGEVQIAVKSVSICGSDLGAYRHSTDRFRPPLVLGHELSGIVTGLGRNANRFAVGQRVTVNPMLYCGDCYYCARGDINLCGNRRSLGTAIGGVQTHGAMREYMTIRESAVLPLPDAVSFSQGALLEPMAVCLACAKCGRDEDEETVVVIGAGPIGLLTIKFLKSLGVPRVAAVDVMTGRLLMAETCGAGLCINATDADPVEAVKNMTRGRVGADRVIVAAGVGSSFLQAFDMVRNGGTVVLVALMHEDIEFDPMQIVGRGTRLFGSYMFTGEMSEAADMLAAGAIQVDDLVTSTFSLADGKQAFDLLCGPNKEVKVQLAMNAALKETGVRRIHPRNFLINIPRFPST